MYENVVANVPKEKKIVHSLNVTIVIFCVDKVTIIRMKILGKILCIIYALIGNRVHILLTNAISFALA
jgi:hypothetical protein